MAKVVIFGIADTAELAWYYLTKDSEHEVVAFTLTAEYLETNSFKGLPVVEFEQIKEIYPPDEFHLFVPMTARKMNKLRENIYNLGKEMGYSYVSYVSSRATTFDNEIGENCFILEDNTIQPFTKIGNNVVLWSGNHIGHHGVIEDHVFFTSHVVMSGHCIIGSHSFFGVNATIRDYSKVGKGTLLAMASSLTNQKTDEWGVYIGNPAKKRDGIFSYDVY